MRCLLLASVVLLAACGTKGGLTLPPKPQAFQATTAVAIAADNSSKTSAETV